MTSGWTRRKALTLSGGVLAVTLLTLVEGCQPVAGYHSAPSTASAASQGNSTAYYSDGKTVLGTFGGTDQQNQAGGDPWASHLMTQVENELTGLNGLSQRELETSGLKVVTTISRPMEVQLYQAVAENLSAASIKKTAGATVTSLPDWALVGAELQDPKNGEVLAEYPGKGQNLSAAACKAGECDVNTAVYARAQVGSSFYPYVLATAVAQGMNVKTSILNASAELCVPPDSESTAFSIVVPSETRACLQPDYAAVSNGGRAAIGASADGRTTVQNALAQSSSTAFADLAHRVGTKNIANLAGQLGVNVASYTQGGSGLDNYVGGVGLALGIAPLTVQEQATMLSTIADNGTYHQAHLIKYWQTPGSAGARQTPKVDAHAVLTPAQDADVQYAMEQTTIDGTAAATVTFGRQHPGTVISKTGTTVSAHSGFFLGATSQYALVVGIFSEKVQPLSDSLSVLGGGSSAYWPAKIWNTFAAAKFDAAAAPFPTNPAFSGQAWNQASQPAAS
jgi:membrane peptidoglycan carboxypeptidase